MSQPPTAPPPPRQLEMLWPEYLLHSPPHVEVPDGYRVRPYRPGDEKGFLRVMELAGFGSWTEEKLKPWLERVLPDGLLFALHLRTDAIAATAMAAHRASSEHPFGGELGWVACDPAHRGHGLGLAVCAAVVARFLSAGFTHIYLLTDDFRLPAIKVYLRLGFVPCVFQDDMPARWRAVCEKLDWPFRPECWPRGRSC